MDMSTLRNASSEAAVLHLSAHDRRSRFVAILHMPAYESAWQVPMAGMRRVAWCWVAAQSSTARALRRARDQLILQDILPLSLPLTNFGPHFGVNHFQVTLQLFDRRIQKRIEVVDGQCRLRLARSVNQFSKLPRHSESPSDVMHPLVMCSTAKTR